MKKSLFAMGMLAMAVASCTNEEVVDIPSSKGISFNNPYVGTSVRAVIPGADAGETTTEKLQEENAGFYVYGGYKDVDDVFKGTHVTYSGGVWGYTPVRYWVDDQVYKFNAYAPDMGVTPTFSWGSDEDANDAVLTFTGITVKGNATYQKDFVIGKSNVQKPTADNIPGNVAITMKHALSMIKVSLTDGFADGVKLKIANFAINGIKTQGNFVQKENVVEGSTGVAGDWTVIGEAEAVGSSSFNHIGYTLNKNNDVYANEYIVIPQAVAADAITVTFDGMLYDVDGHPIEVPGGVVDGIADDGAQGGDIVTNKKSFTIKIPTIEAGWEMNKRYNYTATINGTTFGMKEIIFDDPTIENWGDYSNTPVTIK